MTGRRDTHAERRKEGTHREVQGVGDTQKMEADRLKVPVVEAGRASGRGVGIFKNLRKGIWELGIPVPALCHLLQHQVTKVRVQWTIRVLWDAFLWL